MIMPSETRIFAPTDKVFTSHGLKTIELAECIETRKDNEDWYIECTIIRTIDNIRYIARDYILVVPTKNGAQPFRIGNVTMDMYTVKFKARHVGYDAENYYVPAFSYTDMTCLQLGNAINGLALPLSPFTFATNQGTSKKILAMDKTNLLSAIDGIRSQTGGHVGFNNFEISINDISYVAPYQIEYGANLEDAVITYNYDSVVTTLYPYGNNNLMLPEIYLTADVSYGRPYTKFMVFNANDETTLRAMATAYLNANKVPKVNYVVKSNVIQDVSMGITIKVVAPQFTINTTVIGYTFNVLIQQILTIEFGNYRNDVKSVFSNINGSIKELSNKVQLQQDVLSVGLGVYAQGHNANGYWIKYNDGLMKCWNTLSVTDGVTSAWGSGFISNPITWTYPVAFATGFPVLSGSLVNESNLVSIAGENVGLTTAAFRMIRYATLASATRSISVVAIGRWK